MIEDIQTKTAKLFFLMLAISNLRETSLLFQAFINAKLAKCSLQMSLLSNQRRTEVDGETSLCGVYMTWP